MKRGLKLVLGIATLIIVLGVIYVAGDNPDWTLPVSIRAQEISNLTVDIASQSIDQLDIRITGQSVPVTIEPTDTAVFNISGDVNATIQGTASVSIDQATITVGVATRREDASEAQAVAYAHVQLDTYNYYSDGKTIYTNSGNNTVYLEMVTFRMSSGFAQDMSIQIWILDDTNTIRAIFYAMVTSSYISFDPAIPIPPGWYIKVNAERYSSNPAYTDVSILIRTQ